MAPFNTAHAKAHTGNPWNELADRLASGIIPVCAAMVFDFVFGLDDLGFGLGLRGGDWVVKPFDPPTGLEGGR